MMRILGLLGRVCQTIKRCLNYADFTGPVTTATVNPVPSIIYNDPVVAGSFLFADGENKGADGQESMVNSRNQKDNSKIFPGVNDELAKDENPQSAVRNPKWLVNDDLAACTAGHHSSPTICNNIFPAKPNNNHDAMRRFASFVFLSRTVFCLHERFTKKQTLLKPALLTIRK